jgi:hypothetical protein
MIAVPVCQKTLERRGQKATQLARLALGAFQRLVAQQFSQKIMQGVLRIMVIQTTTPYEAVERIVILSAKLIQGQMSHILVPAPQTGDQGPIGAGKVSCRFVVHG